MPEQTTEESEDDPVHRDHTQGSLDDHERGLPIVRNLFDWLQFAFMGVRMKRPLWTTPKDCDISRF